MVWHFLTHSAPGACAFPPRRARWLSIATAGTEFARATADAAAGVSLDTDIPIVTFVAGGTGFTAIADRESIDTGWDLTRGIVGRDADAVLVRGVPANGVLLDIAPVEQLTSPAGTRPGIIIPITNLILS